MNLLIIFYFFASSFSVNDTPQLTVEIQNIQLHKGKIIIGVYNTDKDFLKEGLAIKIYEINVGQNTESLVIKDLPKGEYAISLYHDENSDNKCNRNFLGIPKEGYGFSNNIKPKFSAPTYDDCKFSFVKNLKLNIKLIK